MTHSFNQMLYLFSCGAHGVAPEGIADIDINKIYTQSLRQGVWQTVFLAIKMLHDNKTIKIEQSVFKQLKYSAMATVINSTKRNHFMRQVFNSLDIADIKYCLLKGEVLSQLYNKSDFRISSDTDIYIGIHNKAKGIQCLEKLGFNFKRVPPTSHHLVAEHPIGGVVELHLHLYDELFEDVWFDNTKTKTEPYRKIKTSDDFEISTLGITDGLIFTTLHFIKHFLTKGCGIRGLMDILLYMKKYEAEIDWQRFHDLLEQLKYQKFMENCIGIGLKYLGFKENDLPKVNFDDTLIEKILIDIENGGIFGAHDEERKGFYVKYTKARFESSRDENFNTYINKWWRPNLLGIIFPSTKNLVLKTPYLKKNKFLYPIAWIHRAIRAGISLIKKEKSLKNILNPAQADYNDTIKKRMELIRELEMV